MPRARSTGAAGRPTALADPRKKAERAARFAEEAKRPPPEVVKSIAHPLGAPLRILDSKMREVDPDDKFLALCKRRIAAGSELTDLQIAELRRLGVDPASLGAKPAETHGSAAAAAGGGAAAAAGGAGSKQKRRPSGVTVEKAAAGAAAADGAAGGEVRVTKARRAGGAAAGSAAAGGGGGATRTVTVTASGAEDADAAGEGAADGDADGSAAGDSAGRKLSSHDSRVRALHKKLRQIDNLLEASRRGKALAPLQLAKVGRRAEVAAELAALGAGS